jgi:nuclear pore complex protein Nup210
VTITPSNDPETSYEMDGIQCSDSAVISTIPRVSPCCPASAIVFAEDVVTKELVRCDVIIDKITAIQILTTTKELHLEEAPSKFHIQGYGSKNNELSTLDGVPFSWVLESPKQSSTITDPQSIMRFIPFSESLYKATDGVATLEAKRMQGDTVLLEGIKTGSADVIARVNDPFYKVTSVVYRSVWMIKDVVDVFDILCRIWRMRE